MTIKKDHCNKYACFTLLTSRFWESTFTDKGMGRMLQALTENKAVSIFRYVS